MEDLTDHFGRGHLNNYLDVDQLIADIGLDEEEIAWRKAFLNFDEKDIDNLEGYADLFEAHADEIVDSFYTHLSENAETKSVIDRSPKTVEQLKLSQKAYLLSLTGGEYDTGYFQQRARIGKLHEQLDMPIKHYIGQYNIYYSLLLGIISDNIRTQLRHSLETELDRLLNDVENDIGVDIERLSQRFYEDVEDGLGDLHSLLKILNLDMQVAVDTYMQSRLNDIELERDRFAALFANVPTPVVVVHITDEGLRVEQVNSAFEELFGYTAADLANRDFEQYLAPEGEQPRPIEDRGIVENISVKSESELSEAEVTLKTQFGQRDFIRVAAPVDREDMDNLEYAFYIDVTDQKQRQERLHVLSRVLRHDIRNKLSVVKGCTGLLEKQEGSAESSRVADRIDEAADELLSTSEQIRSIESLVADDVDQRPINVRSVAEQVIDSVRSRYSDCEFSVQSPDRACVVSLNTVEFAIEEVVENAAIHNDADSPTVDIQIAESLDGEFIDVNVIDNGPGVPPTEYEILTGDRPQSQIEHSSGLGLWMVNWIVKKAGGTLEFSANTPRGSIVTLRLPKASSDSI